MESLGDIVTIVTMMLHGACHQKKQQTFDSTLFFSITTGLRASRAGATRTTVLIMCGATSRLIAALLGRARERS
jgi:hypothetical protein